MEKYSDFNKKIIIKIDPDIEDLIPGFLQNRRNDIKKIQEALTIGDYETIRILGHSMKGSGGGYGFDYISEIGLYLEQFAKKKIYKKIPDLLYKLENYLNNVVVIIE